MKRASALYPLFSCKRGGRAVGFRIHSEAELRRLERQVGGFHRFRRLCQRLVEKVKVAGESSQGLLSRAGLKARVSGNLFQGLREFHAFRLTGAPARCRRLHTKPFVCNIRHFSSYKNCVSPALRKPRLSKVKWLLLYAKCSAHYRLSAGQKNLLRPAAVHFCSWFLCIINAPQKFMCCTAATQAFRSLILIMNLLCALRDSVVQILMTVKSFKGPTP